MRGREGGGSSAGTRRRAGQDAGPGSWPHLGPHCAWGQVEERRSRRQGGRGRGTGSGSRGGARAPGTGSTGDQHEGLHALSPRNRGRHESPERPPNLPRGRDLPSDAWPLARWCSGELREFRDFARELRPRIPHHHIPVQQTRAPHVPRHAKSRYRRGDRLVGRPRPLPPGAARRAATDDGDCACRTSATVSPGPAGRWFVPC